MKRLGVGVDAGQEGRSKDSDIGEEKVEMCHEFLQNP